jgi:CheY-like chemotaxis protein
MQNAAAARFLTLFQHLKSAQLVEDQDRRIALVNQAFCDMFGIPVTPDQLMGTDCAASAEAVIPLFKDPAAFKRTTDHAVSTHAPTDREILELVDGRVLERVFDPFLQASGELTRSSGGTGLGLSIVRDLVQQMGGTVALESRVGAGSTFRVSLPLIEAAAAMEPSSAPISMALLEGLEVLIVEDNEMNSYVARVVLEHAGANVTVVVNGQEALDRLQHVQPDVVLMDIQMPGMDGFEASWRIRNELGLSEAELPIIALTATALADEQRRANASGMTDYIMKPFNPESLCLRIAQILARAGRSTSEMRARLHAPASPNTALLGGRRVLLVEDNEMNRRVATIFLEQSGAEVIPAESGAQALALLARERFDIALMDIQMPGMDGFETTRRIREELGLSASRLPIVALTATSLSDIDRRAKDAEMSDYILKPFHPDLLCRRVAAILASTARATQPPQ